MATKLRQSQSDPFCLVTAGQHSEPSPTADPPSSQGLASSIDELITVMRSGAQSNGSSDDGSTVNAGKYRDPLLW